MIEIAYKVYNNRDEKEKRERLKERQRGVRLQASLLAAAITEGTNKNKGRGQNRGKGRGGWTRRGRGRGTSSLNRTPLGPDQHAYCKKEGHWKNECPQREQTGNPRKGGSEPDTNLIMLETSDTE